MKTRQQTTTRRSFLKETTAVGLAAVVSPCLHAQSIRDTSWIDAHSHIWTRDIAKYPLNPTSSLDKLDPPSFTAEELIELAAKSGVGRVVLIQHFPYHGWDNSYLLDSIKKYPGRFCAVGMIDHQLPNVLQRMKDMLAANVTGFRITPGNDPKNWLNHDGMNAMWRGAAETGQNICLLINPENLSQIDKMCQTYASTPVVIDHFARVGMTGVIKQEDVDALCQLAKHPKIKVKASAYYALGLKAPPYTDLIPMLRRVLDAYGPERVMWASDAPYQTQKGNSYDASIKLITENCPFLSSNDRQWLLKGTAEKTFFWS